MEKADISVMPRQWSQLTAETNPSFSLESQ